MPPPPPPPLPPPARPAFTGSSLSLRRLRGLAQASGSGIQGPEVRPTRRAASRSDYGQSEVRQPEGPQIPAKPTLVSDEGDPLGAPVTIPASTNSRASVIRDRLRPGTAHAFAAEFLVATSSLRVVFRI